MGKKTKLLIALAVGLMSCNITSAFASPSEVYGYKKLAIWDFHESSYDKNGKLRITPETTLFETTGKLSFTKEDIKNNSEDKAMPIRAYKAYKKPDLMSSASKHSSKGSSSHGGSHSGGSDVVSGASNFIGADVVYDFDMLSNAIILKNLGIKDKNVDKIINNWNTTTRTAITERGINVGEGLGIDYDSYMNKAREEYMNGRDLSFEEFAENNKNKTRHLPYKAKYVLEDGTYGSQMVVSQINALNAPKVICDDKNNILGNNIELSFDKNKEWTDDITDIQVGETVLNTTGFKILKNEIKIQDNKIIIKSDKFKIGSNVLKIHANGYRTVILNQDIVIGKVNPKVENDNYIDNPISISNLSDNYLNSIKYVYLNGRKLNSGEYIISTKDGKLTLNKGLFKDAGYYKIMIDTNGKFKTDMLNAEVKNKNQVSVVEDEDKLSSEKIIPVLTAKDTKKGTDEIQIEFKDNKNWEKSIYKVQKVDLVPGLYKELEFRVLSGKILVKQDINKMPTNNKYLLRVFAKGYEPVDVYVNLYKVHPDITLETIPTIGKTFIMGMERNSFDYDWVSNITEVYVDGRKLDKDKEYLRAIERLEIKPSVVTKAGKHTILIKSKGFNDATKDVIYFNENGTRPNVESLPQEKNTLKDVPEDVRINVKDINLGGGLLIDNAFRGDYKPSYITLNGTKLVKNKQFTTSILGSIMISENVINKVGENTIVLHVDGFKDKEIKIEAKVIEESKPSNILPNYSHVNKPQSKPSTPTTAIEIKDEESKPVVTEVKNKDGLKSVPKDVKILDNKSEFNVGEEVPVYIPFGIDYKITSICLNGTELDKNSREISVFGTKIKSNVLNKVGENIVTLKANGYEDKEITITVKGDAKNNNVAQVKNEVKEEKVAPKKEVPQNINVSLSEIIANEEITEEITVNVSDFNYKNQIKSVILNGKELSKFDYDIGFFTIKIKNNLTSKSGEYNLTIKAEGYKDKTFKVKVK